MVWEHQFESPPLATKVVATGIREIVRNRKQKQEIRKPRMGSILSICSCVHSLIHSFIPAVMCLLGAQRCSRSGGNTCRLTQTRLLFSSSIGSLVRQKIMSIDRKKKKRSRHGRQRGKAMYLALETGNRQPRWIPHQRGRPGSPRKTLFLPKETGPKVCSRIPSSKRNNTTSAVTIASSVSFLSCLSSQVSLKKVTRRGRQAGSRCKDVSLDRLGNLP